MPASATTALVADERRRLSGGRRRGINLASVVADPAVIRSLLRTRRTKMSAPAGDTITVFWRMNLIVKFEGRKV